MAPENFRALGDELGLEFSTLAVPFPNFVQQVGIVPVEIPSKFSEYGIGSDPHKLALIATFSLGIVSV